MPQQLPRFIQTAVQQSRQQRIGGLLRLGGRFVFRRSTFLFYLCLNYFQLRHISRVKTLLNDVANASQQIERRFGLFRLGPRR